MFKINTKMTTLYKTRSNKKEMIWQKYISAYRQHGMQRQKNKNKRFGGKNKTAAKMIVQSIVILSRWKIRHEALKAKRKWETVKKIK